MAGLASMQLPQKPLIGLQYWVGVNIVDKLYTRPAPLPLGKTGRLASNTSKFNAKWFFTQNEESEYFLCMLSGILTLVFLFGRLQIHD